MINSNYSSWTIFSSATSYGIKQRKGRGALFSTALDSHEIAKLHQNYSEMDKASPMLIFEDGE